MKVKELKQLLDKFNQDADVEVLSFYQNKGKKLYAFALDRAVPMPKKNGMNCSAIVLVRKYAARRLD